MCLVNVAEGLGSGAFCGTIFYRDTVSFPSLGGTIQLLPCWKLQIASLCWSWVMSLAF